MTTITRLSSARRFMIARITDLAIDVSLTGRYCANASLVTNCWDFSVTIWPAGESANNAVYLDYAYLDRESGSHAAAIILPEMLAKLETLLEESRQAEGQPS